MRIDLLLNKLCLVKTRTLAKKACEMKLVKLNGHFAKPSHIVKENDVIELVLNEKYRKIIISRIPSGNVSKADAGNYYY